MTKAIVKVERTEMGQLVENREELTSTIKALKARLRNLPPWSEKFILQSRQQMLSSMQANIKAYESDLAKAEAALAERDRALELLADAELPNVRQYVERYRSGYYNSLPDEVEHRRQALAHAQTNFDETVARFEAEELVDPHIEASEALATAESALAATKAQIEVLRKSAAKSK